ncbi:MAG: hypothetical protein R3F11_27715 [Verrucomicrobiales bacterium]
MKYDDGFVAWLNGTRVAASPGAVDRIFNQRPTIGRRRRRVRRL